MPNRPLQRARRPWRRVVAAASLAFGLAVAACGDQSTPTGPSGNGVQSGGGSGASSGAATGGTSDGGAGATGGASAVTPAQCAAAPMASGNAYVRRLTRWEYVNTVSDVLGWPGKGDVASLTTLTGLLPADIHANGFSNDYGGQLATLDAAISYQSAADAIGVAMGTTPALLGPYGVTCAPTASGCGDTVAQNLGLRLFRRPLTAAEVQAFGNGTTTTPGLFGKALAAGISTTAGAAVVLVRAMLQSPQFLYRLESQLPLKPGDKARPLDNYEIASRLSYLILSSAPDTALLAAAQGGKLTSPAELTAQISRLMALPEARIMSQRYFREWLFLDGLENENRGTAFTPQLAADMRQETLADVGDQLWDKAQPVLSLFTSQKTTVTPALATYYGSGIGPRGADGSYSTAGLPGRVGFLTHAGVLTMNGGADGSIVQRGLFMLRNVLCENVPDPPPGATAVMLAPATASLRVKSDARLKTQPCMACHSIFDPLAYAYESFDSMGAWQTKDVNGNAVREDGWLTVHGGANQPYTTIADYMHLLAQDPRVSDCIVSRVSQFAWGRPMDTAGDACMLNDIAMRMTSRQTTTFAGMVAAIASSPYFVYTAVQ